MTRQLLKTPIHFNSPVDYRELAKKYDYVAVADGKDIAARQLGVWKDLGPVHITGAFAVGVFEPSTTLLFWNTDYAGSGYARVTPFNSCHAIVGLYCIGHQEYEVDRLFGQFIETEGLGNLEFPCKFTPPVFSTGRVHKFKVDNILLLGRSAGLTDRLMGTGCVAAIESGIMAARAMIKGKDYETLVKPLKKHIENISSFRKIVEKLDNDGLDNMVKMIGTVGIKQVMYNMRFNMVDTVGGVLNRYYKLIGK